MENDRPRDAAVCTRALHPCGPGHGGYSGFIRQQPGLKSYEFAAPGTNVKVIAYVPGCEIDTLDLSGGMSTT